MKIVVLGAGAMGCLYGGRLADSGQDVTLVDIWRDHMEAINRDGLTIEETAGTRVVKNLRGVCAAEEAGPADLVIVFVKATATEEAMAQAKCLVGPETMVLTLQNGLGNAEKLCRVLDPKHVVAGVTGCGASVLGPGRIRHGGQGDTVIGELDGRISERLEAVKKMLDQAGLPAKISTNVSGLVWTKLIGNIGVNALATLTGLQNGRLLDFPETASLMEMAIKEAMAVAEAQGIRFEVDDPVGHTRELAQKTGTNRCSMLQDVTAKRGTEIAVMNGAIVELGRALGVPTPVNLVLSGLIETIQKSYDLRT